MSDPQMQGPVNPMPPVVIALFLVLMGIEAAFSLGARGILGGPGAVGWRLQAMQTYGFSGEILHWMIDKGRWPADQLVRFVSYVFVHASFTQALFSGVFLLAMGKMTAEAFGAVPMLVIFFASAIGGALAYSFFAIAPGWIVGAFPAVYGLIGAYTYMLWLAYDVIGAQRSRAFVLIAVLMGIQLLFGLLFGGSGEWIADLGGFATGFLLSFVVSPGGITRLIARLKRD
jgi:membrane associated rhomboid family serine protease